MKHNQVQTKPSYQVTDSALLTHPMEFHGPHSEGIPFPKEKQTFC